MKNNKSQIEKYYEQIKKGFIDKDNKDLNKEYNNEIVKKTWNYQKQYDFKTNPRQGHEFWNVEADAFKHAFMSADLYFKYGDVGSTYAGIRHELQTPNNPQGEWNMDSWNNQKGREIAKEIKKEYGDNFMKLPQKERDDIIAQKVMDKMKNGELITHPDDSRKFKGFWEETTNNFKKMQEKKITKQTAPINNSTHIYTREEIGKMSQEEFAKHEPEIMKQLKEKGIPTHKELESRRQKASGNNGSDGHWVTINGNHVLIDK